MNYRSGRSHGFSFIEVMAALSILSISLVALLASQNQSMALVERARDMDEAVTLASEKLSELTLLVNQKGFSALKEMEEGSFDADSHPGYRWRYTMTQVPSPNFGSMVQSMAGEEGAQNSNAAVLAGPLQMIQSSWAQSLRELRVEVLWGEPQASRSVDLTTHLFASNSGQALQSLVQGIVGGGSGGESAP